MGIIGPVMALVIGLWAGLPVATPDRQAKAPLPASQQVVVLIVEGMT
jgi:hypothetical protein